MSFGRQRYCLRNIFSTISYEKSTNGNRPNLREKNHHCWPINIGDFGWITCQTPAQRHLNNNKSILASWFSLVDLLSKLSIVWCQKTWFSPMSTLGNIWSIFAQGSLSFSPTLPDHSYLVPLSLPIGRLFPHTQHSFTSAYRTFMRQTGTRHTALFALNIHVDLHVRWCH